VEAGDTLRYIPKNQAAEESEEEDDSTEQKSFSINVMVDDTTHQITVNRSCSLQKIAEYLRDEEDLKLERLQQPFTNRPRSTTLEELGTRPGDTLKYRYLGLRGGMGGKGGKSGKSGKSVEKGSDKGEKGWEHCERTEKYAAGWHYANACLICKKCDPNKDGHFASKCRNRPQQPPSQWHAQGTRHWQNQQVAHALAVQHMLQGNAMANNAAANNAMMPGWEWAQQGKGKGGKGKGK
jgi:hypothetical protein